MSRTITVAGVEVAVSGNIDAITLRRMQACKSVHDAINVLRQSSGQEPIEEAMMVEAARQIIEWEEP